MRSFVCLVYSWLCWCCWWKQLIKKCGWSYWNLEEIATSFKICQPKTLYLSFAVNLKSQELFYKKFNALTFLRSSLMAGACAGTALLSRCRRCCPLFASRSRFHQPTSVPPTHLLFASSTSESSAEGCIDSQAASPLTLSKSSSAELHWIIRPQRAQP